ncbi:MAG: TonB-dependent receptor, partial [Mucilaginibacter sp.]
MKKYLLFIITALLCSSAFAQKITVKGLVTDATTREKLAGVTVLVKSSGEGIATDQNGQFSIAAQANDVLTIRFTGYKMQTITLSGQTYLDIQMVGDVNQLNEVVAVGTRSAGRVKLETPVPVDVVNIAKASMGTGRLDLTDILNYAAPSFNYNKQSGSDGADHVELGTLRGLGPDQTLVLIDGKRRHSTAFVSVFGTRGRGNSGVDLSSIPVSAIDRVEILRDGASAQYGSDAIAGVMNMVLKKTVNQLSVNVGYSGYDDPTYNSRNALAMGQYPHGGTIDGNAISLDANYGLPIGKNKGFINFSLDYEANGKTFRQTHDTAYANPKSLPLNTVRRANGDGSASSINTFFNSEIPLAGTKTIFYGFGGISYKLSNDYAFTRNFSGSPDRFPTDAGGNMIPVSGIIFNTPDGDSYFNPIIQTHNTDASIALGFKGTTASGIDWDISNTVGNNTFHFYGDKTFNASLGATQTHFYDGGPQFLQNSTDLDLSKHYDVLAGLNVGAGAEYRYERYMINAGEPGSYTNFDPNKATGSQGFPGYQPSDEVSAHRSVEGIYLDLEADLTTKWLVDFANRLEHYSDFGYNLSTKFATRYKVTDDFNIRGSIGTGYRAPSLQQINYSSSYTNVQGGLISEVKIAPNYSPITKSAGIPALK